MTSVKNKTDEIKYILENIRNPDRLNEHPWTKSLAVRDEIMSAGSQVRLGPGYHLLSVLSKIFRQMMPSVPPKRGKRLDASWCQFGILAAQYFAPFLYGTTVPTNMRDAWGRIDASILLFVFGKPKEDIIEADAAPYRLTGAELELTPTSTLSDWHTKGLERLADLFVTYEQYLSRQHNEPSLLRSNHRSADEVQATVSGHIKAHSKPITKSRRIAGYVISACVLFAILASGIKAVHLYGLVKNVQADLVQIQTLPRELNSDTVNAIGSLITTARQDVQELQDEAVPFYWLTRGLGWVPVYGGDLASLESLLTLGMESARAVEEFYQAAMPLWQAVSANDSSYGFSSVTSKLIEIQPSLIDARSTLEKAIVARAEIDVSRLSPRTHSLVEGKIDPYLLLVKYALDAAIELPRIMGAGSDGPQTYLILVQNEDELRATGGFITAVGTVVVKDGKILSMVVENSYDLDDLTKPYPFPPWQLYQYMYSQNWVLRDSNWYPDFPISASFAEYFYAYSRNHSVDGIIAIDQYMVILLLRATGSVTIEGESEPITSENVIKFMRSAKDTAQEETVHYKGFIDKLARAIIEKLFSNQDISWLSVAQAVQTGLAEKHILIQLDNPTIQDVAAGMDWDGSLQPGDGDFLMLVDSNIGFNKVNPFVDVNLTLNVDLSGNVLLSELIILHTNRAKTDKPCVQWSPDDISYYNLMNRCYWDYLRIYTTSGAQILDATPQDIPGEWMIRNEAVPARVDILLEEDSFVKGVRGFGTLLVVPAGGIQETRFYFQLPASVLTSSEGLTIYRLRVQKQPGTLAHPLHVQIRLPEGAVLMSASPSGVLEDDLWTFDIIFKEGMLKL